MKAAEQAAVAVRHLLDPLTAEEIEAATGILKRDRGLAASARFVYVTLQEPAKDAVLGYRPGRGVRAPGAYRAPGAGRTQDLRGGGLDHRRRGAPVA